jgi:spore coat protein U-like protein
MKTLKLSMISAAVIAAMGMSAANSTTPSETKNTQIESSTDVAVKCTTINSPEIGFEDYVADDTSDNTKNANLTVKCTKGATFNISLDKGANGSSTTSRLLKNTASSDTLTYSLSKEGGSNWGEGSEKLTATGAGLLTTASSFTIYGKIDALQDVPVGTYSDTVQVSIDY